MTIEECPRNAAKLLEAAEELSLHHEQTIQRLIEDELALSGILAAELSSGKGKL